MHKQTYNGYLQNAFDLIKYKINIMLFNVATKYFVVVTATDVRHKLATICAQCWVKWKLKTSPAIIVGLKYNIGARVVDTTESVN